MSSALTAWFPFSSDSAMMLANGQGVSVFARGGAAHGWPRVFASPQSWRSAVSAGRHAVPSLCARLPDCSLSLLAYSSHNRPPQGGGLHAPQHSRLALPASGGYNPDDEPHLSANGGFTRNSYNNHNINNNTHDSGTASASLRWRLRALWAALVAALRSLFGRCLRCVRLLTSEADDGGDVEMWATADSTVLRSSPAAHKSVAAGAKAQESKGVLIDMVRRFDFFQSSLL
jgi:hypothetical protein